VSGGRPEVLAGLRTDVGVLVGRVADSQRLELVDEPVAERLVHVGVDDESLGSDAGLTAVLVPSPRARLRGGVQISIVEDDERVAAAEFENGLLQVVTSSGGDGASAGPLPVSVAALTRSSATTSSTRSEGTSSDWKTPSG